MGFQVFFECCGPLSVVESDRCAYAPGFKFRGVRTAAFIVFFQTGLQVACGTDIVACRICDAFEDIDIMIALHNGLPGHS